jgi:hypothetical protein
MSHTGICVCVCVCVCVTHVFVSALLHLCFCIWIHTHTRARARSRVCRRACVQVCRIFSTQKMAHVSTLFAHVRTENAELHLEHVGHVVYLM